MGRLGHVRALASAAIARLLPEHSESRRTLDAGRYWASSSSNTDLQDLSHWRGRGRWADDAAWLAIGSRTLGMYERLCRSLGRAPSCRRMAEYGPGGGSNVLALSPHAQSIVGLDISEANLLECTAQCAASGYAGFVPCLLDAASPERGARAHVGSVDALISAAVFQHFPSKEYGARVLGIARSLLRADGCALVQIRYDDGSSTFAPKRRAYERHAVTFTSYAVDEFWDLSRRSGFVPQWVYLEPPARYAWYALACAS